MFSSAILLVLIYFMDMDIESQKFRSGEGLSKEEAEKATKRLEIERSEKILEEVTDGVREMLNKGYDLEEVLESIRREVEGNNKENSH